MCNFHTNINGFNTYYSALIYICFTQILVISTIFILHGFTYIKKLITISTLSTCAHMFFNADKNKIAPVYIDIYIYITCIGWVGHKLELQKM